ncbi:hypothetical protein EON80_10780 [bacterium]|nr:MAG: hypothetical protein EON80_10780 [bacterium]
MKSRPVLMTGTNVLGILALRKTKTRRILKIQPTPNPARLEFWEKGLGGVPANSFIPTSNSGKVGIFEPLHLQCPFGVVGDRLWIRETIWQWGRWVSNGKTKGGRPKRKFVSCGFNVRYVANHPNRPADPPHDRKIVHADELWVKRPAIHMPRAACRVEVELTSIAAERLHDIREADCFAEGIVIDPHHLWRPLGSKEPMRPLTPHQAFQSLWESIHGDDSWDENPWVWVLGFRLVT